MLLLREAEELRKQLELYSFLMEQSRHPGSSREKSLVLVRGGESTDPWMERWTERQEEQQCEPQRLVTTHKELLGDPKGKEHSRPFGSN